MGNIVSINEKSGKYITEVCDFLNTLLLKPPKDFTVGLGVLAIMPLDILQEGVDVNHLHGYISGYISGFIGHIRDDLNKTIDHENSYSSLGVTQLKNFLKDLNDRKSILTLVIGFTDVQITLKFVMLEGGYALIGLWRNATSIHQEALEAFIKHIDTTPNNLYGVIEP